MVAIQLFGADPSAFFSVQKKVRSKESDLEFLGRNQHTDVFLKVTIEKSCLAIFSVISQF